MIKGPLQKLVDKKFSGNWVSAANEMVVLFCEKYEIPGSAGYDFYTEIQKLWERFLKEERERIKEEVRLNKIWMKEKS